MVAHARDLLLGPRLLEARAAARSPSEAALYERNVRTQLTIWGTGGPDGDSEVGDYANKEWGGLMRSFYVPRSASAAVCLLVVEEECASTLYACCSIRAALKTRLRCLELPPQCGPSVACSLVRRRPQPRTLTLGSLNHLPLAGGPCGWSASRRTCAADAHTTPAHGTIRSAHIVTHRNRLLIKCDCIMRRGTVYNCKRLIG